MADRTLAVFTPLNAELPTTNPAQLDKVNDRYFLAFDASTQETAYFAWVAPQTLTTPLKAVISYWMASATANAVVMEVAVEAVSDGDALDLDTTALSFDSDNESASTTVPGTQGYLDQITITLTSNDSIAAGDQVVFRVRRDPANAGDTAAGDLRLSRLEIRDNGA